jgi:hypothetical protein
MSILRILTLLFAAILAPAIALAGSAGPMGGYVMHLILIVLIVIVVLLVKYCGNKSSS